jgi:hypothetical protein
LSDDKDDLRSIGRPPGQSVGSNPDDVSFPVLTFGVLDVHAIAEIARFGPWLDHVGSEVIYADDNLSPHALVTAIYSTTVVSTPGRVVCH